MIYTNGISPTLYKGIFWIDQPNLIYLGISKYIYHFYVFEIQARIVHDVILNRILLPNQNERQEDVNKWLMQEQSMVPLNIFTLIKLQTSYIRDILDFLYTNYQNRSLPVAKFNFDKSNAIMGTCFKRKSDR